jgi:hypothetical protein
MPYNENVEPVVKLPEPFVRVIEVIASVDEPVEPLNIPT